MLLFVDSNRLLERVNPSVISLTLFVVNEFFCLDDVVNFPESVVKRCSTGMGFYRGKDSSIRLAETHR